MVMSDVTFDDNIIQFGLRVMIEEAFHRSDDPEHIAQELIRYISALGEQQFRLRTTQRFKKEPHTKPH